ncbi:MAG: HAD family hydrolase [Cyanobacteria bacterium SIG32]|nr:HAD family hydrolase [Cyanobacteria bacterium SIG32]
MISLKTQNWQIDNIETILFDKDGTFIDLHYFWGKMTELRVEEIIHQFNLNQNLFNDLCLCLGYDIKTSKMLSDGITAMYSRSKIIEIFKSDLEKYGIKTSEQELEKIFDKVSTEFYQNMHQYTKPINSAIEFIKKLHSKGIKLGIVTSDSVESTKLTLKHFGWENLFESVIGRESSPHTKESGEPTKLALKELGANPEKTVMIGDAPMDSISAQNAGIEKIILVATGQIAENTLKSYSPYTIEDLSLIKFL